MGNQGAKDHWCSPSRPNERLVNNNLIFAKKKKTIISFLLIFFLRTSPKDVILKVAGILSVSGGTGAIVEYFGPVSQTKTTNKQTK